MKRKLITLERIIRTGATNFIRNAWLSMAAMAVMVITLSIILVSVVANAAFGHTLQTLTDKIDVSVYLKDEVTPKQKDNLIKQIKALSNVKSVIYEDKDQALANYKKQNEGNLTLLLAIQQTSTNPIPATIHIKPKDPNQIQQIKTLLDKPTIKNLQSNPTSYSGERKEAVDSITQSTRILKRAGVFSVIIFAIISMLIIFNTIQMAIFNRRDELTIMRLLGANTSYIRGPFVVETIIYGVIAAVVSVSLCNALIVIFGETFSAKLLDPSFANEYFAQNFWKILLVQLGIGIFIGAASSILATRRYLKFNTTK